MYSNIKKFIYDFEVFKYDWCVTFKDYQTKKIVTIKNNRPALLKYYREVLVKGILIGYNNKWYDDYIMRCIMQGGDPYDLSLWIIKLGQIPWEDKSLAFKKNTLISWDLIREMSTGGIISLKELEGFMGKKIYECDIPWDLNRPLTAEEMLRAVDYNKYDVEVTELLLTMFLAKLDSHIALIEKYDLPTKTLNMSGASKAALILKAKRIKNYSHFKYVLPERLKQFFTTEDEVIKKFTEYDFLTDRVERKKYPFRFSKQMANFVFDFGLGGGHGAMKNIRLTEEIWNLDVSSYYPSIMIEYDFFSRGVTSGTEKLKEIRDKRVEYKLAGNKGMADGLKMVTVAIYGAKAYPKSELWDPMMQTSICITGQIMLYLLLLRLEPVANIIQVNTDGIMFIPHDKNKCIALYKQWEIDCKMELELSVGVDLIQKDVNNYIFVKSYDFDRADTLAVDKYVKAKGTGVRFWNWRISDENFRHISNLNISNNKTIIDESIVKYFIYGIPVADTITKIHDLVKYQYVVKLMSGFKTLTYKIGDIYTKIKYSDIQNVPIGFQAEDDVVGKCHRLFAVTKDGYDFYKHKIVDDEIINHKIPKSSASMIIDNSDVLSRKNIDVPFLDYNYDIEAAEKIISMYETEE